MEIGIARARNVDHSRHVEFRHLLEERVPGFVCKRRSGPHTTGRVGIEIAANAAQLEHTTFKLLYRVTNRHTDGLR